MKTTRSLTLMIAQRSFRRAEPQETQGRNLLCWIIAALLLPCLTPAPVQAYPPAPHHVLFGTVRTRYGDPLSTGQGEVLFETPAGAQLKGSIDYTLGPGMNYRMEIPMDSGVTADLYKPTALRPLYLFRLRVKIGDSVYLPIQMTGNFSQIGQPGQKTRLDLTLGIDSDGDGLPDDWENELIAIYGGTLAGLRPQDDADGDGISNLNEYLAGTYAFDPTDGFRLVLAGMHDDASVLEFMALRGRSYSIQSSADLNQWTPVSFRIVAGNVAGPLVSGYQSTDVRSVRLEVPATASKSNLFFRAIVE